MTPPAYMQAIVTMNHGGFEQLIYHTDWPTPAVGPHDILIRVHACGMNNTDINTRVGWYSNTVTGDSSTVGEEGTDTEVDTDGGWGGGGVQFPRIQGADVAGTVAAVGAKVTPAKRGWINSRVMVDPWLRDWSDPMDRTQAGYFGSECDGGFAQYVAIHENHVHKIDSDLTHVELATFACAYTTAENMLTRARLAPGERIFITGASGGVGSALIQLAKIRQAHVIALTTSDKAAAVKEIGADQVICRDTQNVFDEVAAASVEVAADVVGAPAFDSCLKLMKRGGRYVTAGAIGGKIVPLDVSKLYLLDHELIGATVTTTDIFPRIISYIESGQLKPLLAKSYPLQDIVNAQTDFLAKKYVGKLVLEIE